MLGEPEVPIYRYNQVAQRQALFFIMLAGVALVALVGVLVVQWGTLGGWTRMIGVVLTVIVVFTVRSQFTRLQYRLRIQPDAIMVDAPTLHRRVELSAIAEVRRLQLPQFGRDARWACAIVVPSPRGSRTPMLLFDNQLEQAEAALALIVARTPRATHTGIMRR